MCRVERDAIHSMIKANKGLYNSRINEKGMEYIFEIIDKTGRKIRLTKEQWKHIIKEHPIVADKIEEIKETLKRPLAVRTSDYDENVRFYYRYYKNINLKEKYLLVIVKYLNGNGFIITIFYINKIKGQK